MKNEQNEPVLVSKPKMACSINITCFQAGENGKLEVEMNYEGESYLAAYLLQDALSYIDQKIEEEEMANNPPLRVVK